MTTKFKIKKVTYGDNSSLYYPMVKRRFWWGWMYMYKIHPQSADGTLRYRVRFEGRDQAKQSIEDYKKKIERRKVIKTEICFYSN